MEYTLKELKEMLKEAEKAEKLAGKTANREALINSLKVGENTTIPYRLYASLKLDVVIPSDYNETTKTINITFDSQDDLDFYIECLRHLKGYKF